MIQRALMEGGTGGARFLFHTLGRWLGFGAIIAFLLLGWVWIILGPDDDFSPRAEEGSTMREEEAVLPTPLPSGLGGVLNELSGDLQEIDERLTQVWRLHEVGLVPQDEWEHTAHLANVYVQVHLDVLQTALEIEASASETSDLPLRFQSLIFIHERFMDYTGTIIDKEMNND